MIAAVTGSNGFIGQHLCARLRAQGWTVRAGMRRDVAADTIDAFVGGADVVIHAAGATRAPSEAALRASNVELTRRVAAASATGGVCRFVLVSSQAAGGPAASLDAPVSEDATSRPIDAYGRSKLDAEHVLVDSRMLNYSIVRPAAVYGPADRDFLSLFRLAKRGIALHPGNRSQWISLVHVDDVVSGILLAATLDAARGGTYYLANDAPVQWPELYRLAAECAGARIGIDLEVPRALVDAGAAAGDVIAKLSGRAGLLTSGKVALSRPPFWICTSARSQRELGFVPHVDVRDGVAAVYDWYRSHGWL